MKDENKTKTQLIKELEEMRKRNAELESGEGRPKPSEPEEDVPRKTFFPPEGGTEDLELAKILDVPAIQSLMDNFYELARIPMSITDLKGKVLVGVGWQDICTKFHRVHPETFRHCVDSDIRLASGVPAGESKLYKCRNNMWDVATPIMVGDKHVGNVFSGQFFFEDEPLDYELFRSQARQYGFPEEDYIAALEAVPRLSRESLDRGMAFFVKLAQMFSRLSFSNIALTRLLAERDTLVNSLQAAEEKYRGIFENSIEGIYRSTPDGKFVEINPAFARIMGYDSPEEVKNSVNNIGWQFYLEPEKRREWMREVAERDYGSFEVQIYRKDGSTRWVSNKARVVRNEQGKPVCFDGFVEDVTERKRSEEELRAAEEKYRGIYENAIEGIFRTTPTGRVLDANPAFARIFGYNSPEAMKCAIIDIGQQLYAEPHIREEWIAFLDQQNYGRFDVQMRKTNGDVCWVCLSARPVRDTEGKTIYYDGFAEDITEQKRAEEELRQYRDHLETLVQERTVQLTESENKYRTIFENTGTATLILEEDATISLVNAEFERLLHYTREELEGKKSLMDFNLEEDYERLLGYHRLRRIDPEAAPKNHELKVVDRLGCRRDVYATVAMIPGTKKSVVSLLDITPLKKAERALAESEALYRNLFENASIGMLHTSSDGQILRINKAFAMMLGYESTDELISTITDAATQIHADPGNHAAALAALQQQDWYYAEEPYIRKDGSIMIGNLAIRKVVKQDGETAYLEGIVEDITERKKVEEALFEREKELRIKAQNLMEVNTTMKVLLNTMEKDQEELKERFLGNIKAQVLPYLEKLEKTPLNEVQKGFIKTAEAYLNDIASPFVQKLTSNYLNLTKKEIQIATLVREGKTSKEIAELLNAKQRVIEFHRENIRKKLGLNNKKGNLAILLRSFS